jgi:UDP-N-acetylmuramoyl-L-alanyl-D-glutamate--2,6-diaminopimelate ligase
MYAFLFVGRVTMILEALVKLAALPIVRRGGNGNPEIRGITADSREVKDGDLFVAIPGTKLNGDTFIADALTRGAAAIVSERPVAGCSVPWIQTINARFALGALAIAFWRIDVDAILFIAVTGTNGKTTTAHLFKELLSEKFGENAVWMFGTIAYHLGRTEHSATHTTPESLTIARLIGAAAERPKAVIMEVSSHSLALDRVGGLRFDLALLTNLTQDHLDFHKSMEQYYQAKKRLFSEYLKTGGRCVINIDDPWGRRLAGESAGKKIATFGKSADAFVRITGSRCSWDGTAIQCMVQGKRMEFSSVLRGDFNVYNMTGMVAGALTLTFDETLIARAYSRVSTVAGRMDRVALAGASYAVIVDYAHTPDALVNILQTSRPLTKGKLICVFGCGGDRDRTKRPLMGAAVAANCDEAIVTSDNPRSEVPMAIIEEILHGIPLDFPHWVIADRRLAIKKALEIAGRDDCVVIAGKGHETYQEIKGVRYPFDDRSVVVEIHAEIERLRHA